MREILSLFYDKLAGNDWKNSSNWKTEAPLKTWFGLTVDSEDRILSIDLPDNNLCGELYDKISEIKTLKKLDLRKNKIKGELPESLKELESLELLNLSSNDLAGVLHGPILEKIIEMRSKKLFVDLSENSEGFLFPSELKNLNLSSDLAHVDLSNCSLVGSIPPFLSKLTGIIFLDLSRNHISGNIPSFLSRLKELQFLHLYNNQLSGQIPKELSALHKLREFSAHTNLLDGVIPDSFLDFKAIEKLSLHNNYFDGELTLSNIQLIFHLNATPVHIFSISRHFSFSKFR